MNRTDDANRYRSYHGTNYYNDGRYDNNFNRRHRNNCQQSTFRHGDRIRHKNPANFTYQHLPVQQKTSNYGQANPRTFSYYAVSSPVPLMTTKPNNSSTVQPVVPQERQSWVRSVQKTKVNESTEQKTQYLETMLRMPQQKSLVNSSAFDRMRFANDHTTSANINAVESTTSLTGNTFHFISNTTDYHDIRTTEQVLFNNAQTMNRDKSPNPQLLPTPPPSIVDCEPNVQTSSETLPHSGFLIDNCEEVEELPPLSSPSRIPISISSTTEEMSEESQTHINEQRAMLVDELDAADAEQRQISKRRKRLQKRLQKLHQLKSTTKGKKPKQSEKSNCNVKTDATDDNNISQLTDAVRRISSDMTDENKVAKINSILKKIKRQQTELRKLRRYLVSMLDDEARQNSANGTGNMTNQNQDLLISFLNQPILSGCWLCSGKMYTEVAAQCDGADK